MAENKLGQFVAKNVVLSFPALKEPKKSVDGNGKPRYGLSFIMHKQKDAEQIRAFQQVMIAVAKDKWGDKAAPIFKSLTAGGRTCFKDGATRLEYGGYSEDVVYVNAACQEDSPPQLVDGARMPVIGAARIDELFYPGAIVNVVVHVWALDHKDPQIGKRLICGLDIVQFAGAGTRIGRAKPKAEELLPVLDAVPLAADGEEQSSDDDFTFD